MQLYAALFVFLPLKVKAILGVFVVLQAHDDILSTVRLHQNSSVTFRNESRRYSRLDPLYEAIPVSLNIVQHNALIMNAKLVPRCNLHELFQSAISATQRDKAAPWSALNHFTRHHLLSRVHIPDHCGPSIYVLIYCLVDIASVRRIKSLLTFHKSCGDDTMDCVGSRQRNQGPGELAHDSDRAAAVDELYAMFVEDFGQAARRREMDGIRSG